MKPLFGLALLALPAFAAFPNGYSYCKVVTTQHAMVSGTSDLTNFPLTVVLTDADLRTAGNGGLVNNGSGFDIGFYADCSGSGTALKWEMESYAPATGAIVAHVLRPTLSHTADDTVGMFYGGSFSSFQSTVSAVWDANYKAIYHLSTPDTPNDSTATGANGANHGATPATGQLGGGAATTGTQYLTAPIDLTGTQTVTVEAWFLKGSYANDDALLLEFTPNAGAFNSGGFALDPNSSGTNFEVFSASSTGGPSGTDDVTFTRPSAGAWHHIAVVIDFSLASNEIGSIYIDGISQSLTRPFSANNTGTFANSTLYFMSRAGTSLFTAGLIDEVRVSVITRSSDWILTEYRNQSAPGTYISAGPRIGVTARVRHVVIGGE